MTVTEFSTWDIREWERPLDEFLRMRPRGAFIERRYTKHKDGRYTIAAVVNGTPRYEVELTEFTLPGCRPRTHVKAYELTSNLP